jgi:hypothetical protein
VQEILSSFSTPPLVLNPSVADFREPLPVSLCHFSVP